VKSKKPEEKKEIKKSEVDEKNAWNMREVWIT
jgi:hypothetical protein